MIFFRFVVDWFCSKYRNNPELLERVQASTLAEENNNSAHRQHSQQNILPNNMPPAPAQEEFEIFPNEVEINIGGMSPFPGAKERVDSELLANE